MREDRRSFGEEITPVVTGPVLGANDEDEDEDWEDEEEEEQQEKHEEKEEDEEDDEEEDEPVWTVFAAGRILSGISGAIYVSFYFHA